MKRVLTVFLTLLFLSSSAWAQQHIHGGEIEPGEYSSDSLYQVDSTWTSSEGRQLHLGELAGKPRLVALFYASCVSACPAIVDAMQRVERESRTTNGESLGMVLVTFDTEEDTPAVLEHYAQKRGLDHKQWLLLRGGEDDTRELAVLLGSKFKKLGSKSYAHSNLIALLDRDGRIVARAKSLSDIASFSGEVHKFLETHPAQE